MRHGELKVSLEGSEEAPVIRAEGEIDLGTVDALRSAALQAVKLRPKSVVFDLRAVSYIDGSGLGVLMATLKRMGREPGSVVVIANQPAVLQALQLTGLDRVLRVLREPATAGRGPA